ncbi:MAG: DUF3226 domain-containing protein [Pseudomonadota bacterium]
MSDGWEFEEKRFLLCEGDHDKSILEFLITERKLGPFQIKTSFECIGSGGIDAFIPALKGFRAIRGFKKLTGIAIVVDNDDPQRLPGLAKQLSRQFHVQMTPDYRGVFHGKDFMLIPIPGIAEYGDLERLCLPALFSIWPHAEEGVKAYLEWTGANEWKKRSQLWKAKVRCTISGYHEDDPYKGLGYLFKGEKFRHLARHPCFDGLVGILKDFDDVIKAPSP